MEEYIKNEIIKGTMNKLKIILASVIVGLILFKILKIINQYG